MLTRFFALAACVVAFAGTAYSQGNNAGAGAVRPRGDAGANSRAMPPAPASAPTTGSPILLPGVGIIVPPDDGGRPPRPEASPGTPANPSGLKKPD
ncbi:hypothetical protein LMG27174_03260 [Paraburkholderia rhynchosiae]|uniref:Uncharacterized protein n=1 Tax=Paraburkholderia rhynchosiae TaxID=487049 RepID=A0A2N7WKX7_9BURK|nr:hypothetical protein C0Z16_16640 [Paraburkholderia rhynchosiae]CAB3692954.1 hypothetical protein LMG27174_03260 [Paraburkholderia rhynchosiae]